MLLRWIVVDGDIWDWYILYEIKFGCFIKKYSYIII